MNVNKFSMACFAITSIFTVSILIAPFFLDGNTVERLDGSAWKIDYSEKWNGMLLFPRLVYYFGDVKTATRNTIVLIP